MNNFLYQWRHILPGKFFRCNYLTEVFTPQCVAKAAYISREEAEQEMYSGIRTPGMQVVVCGPARSGKSSLTYRVLLEAKKRYIISRCTENTTIDMLVANGFAQLPPRYTKSRKERRWDKIAGALWARQAAAGNPRWPFYHTPQRLGELLADSDMVWVVEDFHQVPDPERQKMLQVIKVFSDLSDGCGGPKLVVLGTAIAALELFYYDADMANRIAEVDLSYMDETEIARIIHMGERLLNISFSAKLRNKLVQYANSLPDISHGLGFVLCRQKGIWKKQAAVISFTEQDLMKGIENFLSEHNRYVPIIAEVVRRSDDVNLSRLLELLARSDQKGLTASKILQHRHFQDMAQLQLALHELTRIGGQPILMQCPYSDAYAFADPYMKAYARMYFECIKYTCVKKTCDQKTDGTPTRHH